MSRSTMINWAIWESNYGEWKPSVKEMNSFFTTAGLAALPENMIRGSLYGGAPPYTKITQGVWALAGGKNADGSLRLNRIHWCGIFATYVLKHWAGLAVKWVYGTGIVGDGVTLRKGSANIRPGDVAVIKGKANARGEFAIHHFIVTAMDKGANRLQSVDGNSGDNSIVWHTDKKIVYTGADADPYNIWYYYQTNA